MNGLLLLIVCFFGYGFGFFSVGLFGTVQENEDAILQCFNNTSNRVHWQKVNGTLPKRVIRKNGSLIIKKAQLEDSGLYSCTSTGGGNRKISYFNFKVIPRTTVTPVTSTRVPSTFGFTSDSQLLTTSKGSGSPVSFVNTPYPCLYGICNGTCCAESTSAAVMLFDCANGQKINKSLVCNHNNDCEDGSDESRCEPWPSKIVVLPKLKMEVFCGDEIEGKVGDSLILECHSAGHPIPTIRWKKYDGHVPSKCQQFSKRGHGILTCPNFQQSDQGAYSCVAENSVKSAESQPKSVVKCNNTVNCKGFKVVNDEQIEHCLECYCSGKTTQCQNIKSSTTEINMPAPENQVEIFAKENGEILFVPTKTNPSPEPKIRNEGVPITYCSLSENDFPEKSFVKSFGRNVIFPRHKGKINFLQKAPDLIIRGNGLTLMYTASLLSPIKGNLMVVAARFWPGNWHHLDKKAAGRRDLMKVLSNLDTLLIRCEYEEAKEINLNTSIIVESSRITHSTHSVSYVEKCNCPTGYDGLSCETCAVGYKQKPEGGGFICEKIYVPPPCKEGHTGINCGDCDTTKGFFKNGEICSKAVCHPAGSTSVFHNISKKCNCREGVTGEFCDRCENGSFFLHKERGCLKCWCNGVTDQCDSSKLYRTVISNIPRGGYNSSDGRNFWLLPSDFSGNRLTSYGGYLNYTMKYKPKIPKENTYLTVEFLSMDDVTLVYTHSTYDTSVTKEEKSWSVPLTEIHWRKPDKSKISRGEFLTVLSKIKAVYIESPYHLSSGYANLTSTRMSSASSSGGDEDELALEVEQCHCPPGYRGLSCERCSDGFYKKRNGTITQCIKCDCSNCDPDIGCSDCPELQYRDNPEEEKMPLCKPCPCNGNAVSCVKDDHNQIFCRCKPGFTGMHCENTIPKKGNDFTISISPRRIKDKRVGTQIRFNCSVISSENMVLSAIKTFVGSAHNNSTISLGRGSNLSETFDIILESGVQTVECYARDGEGKLAGHVVAMVEGLITVSRPVKITHCYSNWIEVKESESKELICEASGSPTPMITWYKNVNGSAVKVDTSDGVHSIESASVKDNGTMYTCVAENSEGDKATCTGVLLVRRKCEVVNIIPKDIRTTEGKNVSMQCKTTAKSTVTWSSLDTLFNREKPITSPRVKVQNGELLITDASVLDSGTYICTANGENGKINQTTVIVVEEKRIPPTAIIKDYDRILNVGESFETTCIVTGKPTPTVTWKKVNDTLAYNANASGETLSINRATIRNSGIYQCEARSISGNASSYISIQVKEPFIAPKVNLSEETVVAQEGEEYTLSCLATGYPRPKLYWYARDVNLTNVSRKNDMVLIHPLEAIKEDVKFVVTKRMDGSDIICQGENSAGRHQKTSRIKVLQAKDGINETIELVPIGSFFEMQCDFGVNVIWDKVNGRLVGDECAVLNMLTIQSVQIQHNGTYLCKENSETKKRINLIVVGFVPKFTKALKSYLVLPVQLTTGDIRIELSFYPTHDNGVLLQEENNNLDVYLEGRQIHVFMRFSDNDTLDIAMNKPITLWRWYSLSITVSMNYVDITIYDQETLIHERKTEKLSKFFTLDPDLWGAAFFVGGPIPVARHIRKFFFRRLPYFDGSISRLSINRHEFDMVKEGSHSYSVTLYRRCSQEPNICGNRGKCLDAPTQLGFICVCPNDFKHKNETCPSSCARKGCQTQLDLCTLLNPCNRNINTCIHDMSYLQCNCAYGYSGTTCERVQEYSFCARGNGYVKLPSMLLERHLGAPEVIRMSFTLHKENGVLLWQGDTANHLLISVHGNKLRYVYSNQNTKLEIHAREEVALDKKYILNIKRINSSAVMEFHLATQKDLPDRYKNSTNRYHTNRVVGDIYLGNVPNATHHQHHRAGLNGCIHYISFGDKAKVNFPEVDVEKVNVFSPPQKEAEDNSDESSDYNDVDSDSNNSEEDSSQ